MTEAALGDRVRAGTRPDREPARAAGGTEPPPAEKATIQTEARLTQVIATASGEAQITLLAAEGLGDGASGRITAASGAPVPAALPGPPAPAPDPARSAVEQVAAAVQSTTEGTIEIHLAPEELGRVSMALHTAEGSLSLSIHAERPETLDLLRRNIEMLVREFREQGFASLDLSFGSGSQEPSRPRPAQDRAPADTAAGTSAVPAARASGPPAPRSAGLDLRL